MPYEAKNFENLIGTEGFSEQLLKNHFTLYQGYVANTNKVSDLLVTLLKEGKMGTPEYAELKRRFGWEYNGMVLHELYFGNLIKGGKPLQMKEIHPIYLQLEKDFGSFENWEKDFRATGAMRGIGWVILYYDKTAKRLFNIWVNEHDIGHLSNAVPLLIMDVFEHAYMIDYGLKKPDYINSFFKAINWDIVLKRFDS
ncbi:Superoxide dismutase [Fe] [Candidatus Bilamarchaeum dharawalense]|uniref:superoxide dismutase n=1 Tax=Candidatus Bilamarchaeum dharawalense TaxID=2885759 RepID=A0A5E4LNM1_9ARCH|nr:Superoxide dismutase [Fe] [Candidatus Bilamarchaeum dharawalense]